MRSLRLAAAALALVVSFPGDADAAAAGALIVDVREGRVLYVIVDARERYLTLPIRALREEAGGVRLDMDEEGELAEARGEPRFRRAARLIGQPLENRGDSRTRARWYRRATLSPAWWSSGSIRG